MMTPHCLPPLFDRTAQQEVNDALAAANGKLVLRVKELEEALRPFAQWCELTEHQLWPEGVIDPPDDHPVLSRRNAGYRITIGDFKRARKALRSEP